MAYLRDTQYANLYIVHKADDQPDERVSVADSMWQADEHGMYNALIVFFDAVVREGPKSVYTFTLRNLDGVYDIWYDDNYYLEMDGVRPKPKPYVPQSSMRSWQDSAGIPKTVWFGYDPRPPPPSRIATALFIASAVTAAATPFLWDRQ